MNRLILAVLFVFSIAAPSCSDENTGEETNNVSVLNTPAFAGISDSIRRSPNNVELLLIRATRLSQNNYHKAATDDYKKAYELSGDEGIAMEYASNLLLSNNTTKAKQVLEEGSRKFPDNTEFSRRLAEIHAQTGNNEAALTEYNKILQSDSLNFEALYDKGTLLARLKDTAGAIQALERSFAVLPINLTGMALANIYIAKKDPRTVEICDIILKRDSAQLLTEPVYMKGIYYNEVNQHEKAIAQFDECIRRDWKMTDAYIEKGIIYFEQKNIKEALKVFNMAATVSNTDADVYFWIGRCHEQQGNRAEAILNYKRALALDDTFVEAKDALRRLNS